tara:strand:- start:12521 stop:13510 length:990 start_codon:yes stop_codon:yes gene_type:complete
MAATDSNRESQRGATGQKLSFSHRWRGYKAHHRATLRSSFKKILSEPMQTMLTAMVIAIALALPATLYLVIDNVQKLGGDIESSTQITVFVRKIAKPEAIKGLEGKLKAMTGVVAVEYISAQQALLEFKALSGFGSALRYLEDNPLPAVFLVQPLVKDNIDLAQTNKLVETIAALPAVDDVQIDMAWLVRLHSLIEMGQKIALTLGILLGIGVLLVIGNTIRLAIESRRDEIIVVKLVGGTNPYVRRPFLYTGLLLGLFGALIAAIMLFSGLQWMSSSMENLASLYQSQYRLEGLGIAGFFTLMLVGSSFGLGGAWIAVSRHLRDIEPR